MYSLNEGYLSFPDTYKQFQNIESLDENTTFEVFYLSNVFESFNFVHHSIWIYFCNLTGNCPLTGLKENFKFQEKIKINCDEKPYSSLLSYMSKHEEELRDSYYAEIRECYSSVSF